MDNSVSNLNNKKRIYFLAIALVLVLIAIFSFTAWFLSETVSNIAEERSLAEFSSETQRITLKIDQLLNEYTSILFAARGLFNASDFVDRKEWNSFIQAQDIENRYPALKALEFIKRIEQKEKDEYLESVRSDTSISLLGYPDFSISPAGDREVYYTVHYIEPLLGNEAAFGFDLFSDDSRKMAIELARDSNSIIVTEPITLVQEEVSQKAVLILLPVYEKNLSLTSLKARRDNITGLIAGVVRIKDLSTQVALTSSFGRNISFNLVDVTDEPQVLSISTLSDGEDVEEILEVGASINSQKKRITIGTRIWELNLKTDNVVSLSQIESLMPELIFGIGLIISFLTGFALFKSLRLRGHAEEIASEMTMDLQKRTEENEIIKQQISKKNEMLTNKLKEIEEFNKHMVGRELRMAELKKELDNLKANNTQ